MPSVDHESLVLPFRENPRLVAELLSRAFGVPVPRGRGASVLDGAWTEVQRSEWRVDLAVLLGKGRKRICVLIEVQLRTQEDKPYRWPLYVAGMRDRCRCPVYLLVVTPSESIPGTTSSR